MADCIKSLELLSEFRDGALEDAEVIWVKAHLEECPPCKCIFDDLDAIIATARTLTIDSVIFPDENLIWQRIGFGRDTVH